MSGDVVSSAPTDAGILLVTGADGFVGRAVIARARAAGWRVRAATRSGRPVAGADSSVAVGDLAEVRDWSDALAGCAAVAHLAARVHLPSAAGAAEAAAFDAVNVAASERLAEQAAVAGVRRFVFISTVKVLGEGRDDRPCRDDDPPAPVGAYACSKLAAEQRLFGLAARVGLEVTVLRPPLVYGPGVKANFFRLMDRVARGWPLPLAGLNTRRSFLYVDNLADAVVTTLAHPDAAGRRFLVADATTIALPDFVRRLGLALGRPARLFPLPVGAMRRLADWFGQAEAVARLTRSLEVDAAGLREGLGWHPPHGLDAALAETARWYWSRHGR